MARFFKDPLLHGTKGLLRVGYILCFGIAVFLAVVATIGSLSADVRPMTTLTPAQFRDGVIQIFMIVPLLAIIGWFLRILWQIVGTVAAGSPFDALNAGRLNKMGWLSLLLLGASRLGNIALDTAKPIFESPGSLLLALTLFILARVFRQGAAMREDLEGTV